MRHHATTFVALLTAAGVLFPSFPTATGGWGFGRFVNGNDFVFTRYAP